MIDITHKEACDFAKLTMLVYEYGKTFTIDKDMNLESFVSNENLSNTINNPVRLEAIQSLAEGSPHGKVHSFFNIESTDLQVGITISEVNKRITVVFRGSESRSDWYYDLSLLKVKLQDDVYVHSGFYNQLHKEGTYEKIKDEIVSLLEEHPDYKVFITGHSLGGALSTLFGYELSKIITETITVISFASPRVGNSYFRKHFDEQDNLNHYRISNEKDVVTAVPMINYQHVGINISLNNKNFEIFENYSYNTWLKFSLFYCWKVSEHNMDLYYERLLRYKW